MDFYELRASTSYQSGRTELSSPETSHHTFGNVYATGNAVVQLGDSIHSQLGRSVEDIARLNGLVERQKKAELQDVRNALYYDSMDDRKARLKPVSEVSVAWIWSTDFTAWLTGSGPFFWITGKPGSGKSTLMNCICSSQHTIQLLQSDGDDWITIDFYFDNNAGSAVSNSVNGLLRSFLFQLTGRLSSLGQQIHDRHSHALRGSWLDRESELVNTLCDAVRSVSAKICAFIDGIDEFTGKLRGLIIILRDIQNRTGMKICLASRPDKMVSRLLAASPSLQVENHNVATIQNYIETACETLTEEEIESSRPLWQLIEQEANGIILWARFVVDELVDQLVVGATMKELEDILHTFPTEMESVYERVLRDLSDEQKLQAAIAFYILEHGLEDFRSTHEIPKYDFFVAWSVMVERLGHGIRFDSKFDLKQFEIRIEAMLGGLLEFPPAGTVRYVHTTFENYLRRTPTFHAITQETIDPVYGEGLAGEVFLRVISQASKQVTVDLSRIEIGNIGGDYSQPWDPAELLEYISPNDLTGHFGHRLEFLLMAVGRLGQVLHDSQNQASNVWTVVNSSLFELHQVLCSHIGCGCSQDFRSNSSFWRDRWCLYFLATHGLFFAFEHGLKETKNGSPDAQVDMLEVTIDVVRKAQLDLEQASNLTELSKPKRSPFGLDGHRLIELLLEDEPLNLSHLAICQIIEFPSEPRFAKRIRQLPLPTNFQMSIPSTWIPYPSSNLLCCWAWCSDPCYNRHVQASRLQSLLEVGFDVNAKAYPGGTVLHALFDYQEPIPISSHTRLYHVTWPFNSVKFNLLREAGFDFASPLADDLLEHARRFQVDLARRNQWLKLRPEERKQISDLEAFVTNVLEPLCRRNSAPAWRSHTPPNLDQSSARGSPRFLATGATSRARRERVSPSYGPFLLTN